MFPAAEGSALSCNICKAGSVPKPFMAVVWEPQRKNQIPASQQIWKQEFTFKGQKEIERLTEDCSKSFHLLLGMLIVT